MREDETYCDFCGKVTKEKFVELYRNKLMCSDCYSELVKCTHCHREYQEKELIEFEGKLFCESCLDDVGLAYCTFCGNYYQIIDDKDEQLMCYECRKDLEYLKKQIIKENIIQNLIKILGKEDE